MKIFYSGLMSIALLLLAAAAAAQEADAPAPLAKISGPVLAPPGELVVLNSNESVGHKYKWILPTDKAQDSGACDGVKSQVFFATTVPGEYSFILIVTSDKGDIEYAVHTLTVVGNLPKPDPGQPDVGQPDPGRPDPVQPNPGDGSPDFGEFKELYDISKRNSLALNDPETRKRLKGSLEAILADLSQRCDRGVCPPLATCQSLVLRAVEDTLLTREGNSRNVAWSTGWRAPVNNWMSQNPTASAEVYLQAFQAVLAGLE